MRIGGRGWWILVGVYAVVLLGIQSILGVGVDVFKERWGAAALETTVMVVVVVGTLVVTAFLARCWIRCTAGERVWLVAMLVLYGLGVLRLEIAQERLHYLQYGLLAALVYLGHAAAVADPAPRRLSTPDGAPLRHAVVLAVLVAGGLGLVDEVLQEWVWPRRYFDWRDVQLNLRAAALGVAVAAPALAGWRRRGNDQGPTGS